MKDTTTHCDYCDEPLGSKCDREIFAAGRAKRRGILAFNFHVIGDDRWTFFCSQKCVDSYLLKLMESNGKTTIQKTHSEEKEKPVD